MALLKYLNDNFPSNDNADAQDLKVFLNLMTNLERNNLDSFEFFK